MMEASSKDKSSALLKKVTENYAAIQANTPEEKEKSSLQLPKQIRTYWWRWWVLGVLMSNNILANLLWITFAPVADVMRCYYNITNDVVNALSLASAGITLLLVLPSAWCLSRFGLRFTLILSSIAAALGAGIRVMGAGAGYFSLLMTGQIVSSFDGILEGGFTLFSEVWFPSSERATATALSASIAPQVRGGLCLCVWVYLVWCPQVWIHGYVCCPHYSFLNIYVVSTLVQISILLGM